MSKLIDLGLYIFSAERLQAVLMNSAFISFKLLFYRFYEPYGITRSCYLSELFIGLFKKKVTVMVQSVREKVLFRNLNFVPPVVLHATGDLFTL